MCIEDVQTLYDKELVILTQHFIDRIGIRGISLIDVKTAIFNGYIIEQYPDDYPHPSALILGFSEDKPLHVLIGKNGGYVWLITSYKPESTKWENDYKTRKAVK